MKEIKITNNVLACARDFQKLKNATIISVSGKDFAWERAKAIPRFSASKKFLTETIAEHTLFADNLTLAKTFVEKMRARSRAYYHKTKDKQPKKIELKKAEIEEASILDTHIRPSKYAELYDKISLMKEGEKVTTKYDTDGQCQAIRATVIAKFGPKIDIFRNSLHQTLMFKINPYKMKKNV